jgi:hypothetical protein
MERPDLEQALGRLLGPAGAEIGCDACFDELDRYIELGIAGADADAAIPGLRAHLAGCPACREEHDRLQALISGKTGLAAGKRYPGSVAYSGPTGMPTTIVRIDT